MRIHDEDIRVVLYTRPKIEGFSLLYANGDGGKKKRQGYTLDTEKKGKGHKPTRHHPHPRSRPALGGLYKEFEQTRSCLFLFPFVVYAYSMSDERGTRDASLHLNAHAKLVEYLNQNRKRSSTPGGDMDALSTIKKVLERGAQFFGIKAPDQSGTTTTEENLSSATELIKKAVAKKQRLEREIEIANRSRSSDGNDSEEIKQIEPVRTAFRPTLAKMMITRRYQENEKQRSRALKEFDRKQKVAPIRRPVSKRVSLATTIREFFEEKREREMQKRRRQTQKEQELEKTKTLIRNLKKAQSILRKEAGRAQQQEEAVQKAQEEADRKTQEEADRKAQEEAQPEAQEDADRKAQEEAQPEAQEDADRKAQEEAQPEVDPRDAFRSRFGLMTDNVYNRFGKYMKLKYKNQKGPVTYDQYKEEIKDDDALITFVHLRAATEDIKKSDDTEEKDGPKFIRNEHYYTDKKSIDYDTWINTLLSTRPFKEGTHKMYPHSNNPVPEDYTKLENEEEKKAVISTIVLRRKYEYLYAKNILKQDDQGKSQEFVSKTLRSLISESTDVSQTKRDFTISNIMDGIRNTIQFDVREYILNSDKIPKQAFIPLIAYFIARHPSKFFEMYETPDNVKRLLTYRLNNSKTSSRIFRLSNLDTVKNKIIEILQWLESQGKNVLTEKQEEEAQQEEEKAREEEEKAQQEEEARKEAEARRKAAEEKRALNAKFGPNMDKIQGKFYAYKRIQKLQYKLPRNNYQAFLDAFDKGGEFATGNFRQYVNKEVVQPLEDILKPLFVATRKNYGYSRLQIENILTSFPFTDFTTPSEDAKDGKWPPSSAHSLDFPMTQSTMALYAKYEELFIQSNKMSGQSIFESTMGILNAQINLMMHGNQVDAERKMMINKFIFNILDGIQYITKTSQKLQELLGKDYREVLDYKLLIPYISYWISRHPSLFFQPHMLQLPKNCNELLMTVPRSTYVGWAVGVLKRQLQRLSDRRYGDQDLPTILQRLECLGQQNEEKELTDDEPDLPPLELLLSDFQPYAYEAVKQKRFKQGDRFLNTRSGQKGTVRSYRDDDYERRERKTDPTRHYYAVVYDDGKTESYETQDVMAKLMGPRNNEILDENNPRDYLEALKTATQADFAPLYHDHV